ncbi:Gpi1-domain-containing protein, partial [Clavulina sp. PMI_390]
YSFYNCVWLILNDMIVGWTFGTFLRDNSELLGNLVGHYTTVRRLSSSSYPVGLLWLDDWPAGLKLNTELSHFFCQSYLAGIDVWSGGLTSIIPYFPHIIYLIGCSGPLGFTMTLSLISDVIGLLTAPLYFSYLVATSIFRTQLSAAGSLWRLFRGKRRNVLQNRTDAWEYDMDQLLLGTILFTLLAFLFPTIVVYYLLFAVVRLLTIFVHASLETLLVFMNHFPLFTVMLRLKDPARLPGMRYSPPSYLSYLHQPTVVLTCSFFKNSPIPLSRIFFQYLRLWSNLTAHYSPLRLLKCLLTGGFITPIERYSIRYDSSAPS